MGMLDLVQGISKEPHNKLWVFMGKPGSGKTTVVGTFPKPMLYVAIDTDGGGEVLKCYSDDEIKTLQLKSDEPGTAGAKHIQTKCIELINELLSVNHPYKTIVFDAYSSVEEGVVSFLEKSKGKKLNLDERGSIATLMLNLRNKLVDLSRTNVDVVTICHIKDKKTTDNTTGEESTMLVPKMSYNNGNILLERASAVIYTSKRTIINDDNTRRVAFLSYVGAHPNMDTKFRTEGKMLETGMYLENATYEKFEELRTNKQTVEKVEKLNVVESQTNPFSEENDDKSDKEEW